MVDCSATLGSVEFVEGSAIVAVVMAVVVVVSRLIYARRLSRHREEHIAITIDISNDLT